MNSRADSQLARFLAQHGLSSYEALRDRAAADPDWFWRAVMAFHNLHFFRPFDRLLDLSEGPEWPQWCVGGTTNLAWNCLDRTLAAGRGEHCAVVWEAEDGERRSLNYTELTALVRRAAAGLAGLGIARGDVVGMYMPMVPETMAAYLAIVEHRRDRASDVLRLRRRRCRRAAGGCAGQGGHHRRLHLAQGQAIRDARSGRRSDVVGAVAAACRRGRARRRQRDARVASPQALGRPRRRPRRTAAAGTAGRSARDDRLYVRHHRQAQGHDPHPLRLHDQGGARFRAGARPAGARPPAVDERHGLARRPHPRRGGPTMLGAHDRARGRRARLSGAGPDLAAGRRTIAVTFLGVAPTMVRTFMQQRRRARGATTTSSRCASWSPPASRGPRRRGTWLFERVGRSRVPLLNFSGGTEMRRHPRAARSAPAASPARSTRRSPAPAPTWSTRHGRSLPRAGGRAGDARPSDRADARAVARRRSATSTATGARGRASGSTATSPSFDADGHWHIHGRSDDTLKIAGKRTGPAEIESLLLATGKVAEAAAIGAARSDQGPALVCVCVPRAGDAVAGRPAPRNWRAP